MTRAETRLLAAVLAVLATVTAGVVVATGRFLRPFAVVGRSMEPTLLPGDRVLVDLRAYRESFPEVGDVVLVRTPDGARIVKRVSGRSAGAGGPARPRQVWVLGDNPRASVDSRDLGPVAPSAIVGRVVLRYWPPSRVGAIGSGPPRSPAAPAPPGR